MIAAKKKVNMPWIACGIPVMLWLCGLSAFGETNAPREYKIKAAFVYNFIKTTQWPQETDKGPSTITIGIIGNNPFGNAFAPIENQTVRDRTLVIRYFDGLSARGKTKDGKPNLPDDDLVSLRRCHVLFICSSEAAFLETILKAVENCHVLTVSEVNGFVDNGGMINFIPRATKGEFEVNLITLEKAGLKISSKILRIAKRVVSPEK